MKKWILFLVVFLFYQINVFAMENVNSPYIYFYQLDKQEVLYEENSEDEISIASLTKIMTAYVALDMIEDLSDTVILTANDFKGLTEANAYQAGFEMGEKVTYEDLLYGLLLPSGADAALSLANHLAGSEEAFVEKMNEKVSKLGLEHTHFSNVIGLDDEENYSSVQDVALLLIEALKNPDFKTIFTSYRYMTSNKKHTFHSSLAKSANQYSIDVSYIKGSKTGYTYDAGLCLASIAEYEGSNYLLITAGADYTQHKPLQILDSKTIYDYFFENYSYQEVLKEGDYVTTLSDENDYEYSIVAHHTIEKYVSDTSVVTYQYEGIDKLDKTYQKGDKVGEYKILVDGEVVATEIVYLDMDMIIPKKKNSYFPIISLFILILLFLISLTKRKKKKVSH